MDPIHEKDGKWWFWNEIWSDRYGPYNSREEADARLKDYTATLYDEPYA